MTEEINYSYTWLYTDNNLDVNIHYLDTQCYMPTCVPQPNKTAGLQGLVTNWYLWEPAFLSDLGVIKQSLK